ncbi:aminoglycoside phosphotransferase family protein [Pseudonocardia sp. CA-107938]|uniref:aminoglycoside phosphotransferase family protein n=1 Tax=Pseudonocardia sp. CA-107938 TaxID=3240021 RepID=UPI003D8FFFEC
MHVDQITITVEDARRLVDEQFPQWRGLPLRAVASAGTVNAIIRIGDGLTARFPLRGRDPVRVRAELEAEAAAARELAACSPVPTPRPVAIGEPGEGYPLPWSVQTWVPGRVATPHEPAGSTAFARDLAAFISALRAVDTRGRRFAGTGRGGDLRDHDDWMQTCLRESEGLLDVPRLRALWAELRDLPPAGPDVMSHHDLIPGNVLVRDGRLAGVLDGGGFGPADPALDLVAAWHLLDDAPRAELRRLLGCDDVEWARGRAWAFHQAMGLVWYYAETNPPMSALGRSTLDRLTRSWRRGPAAPAGVPRAARTARRGSPTSSG